MSFLDMLGKERLGGQELRGRTMVLALAGRMFEYAGWRH